MFLILHILIGICLPWIVEGIGDAAHLKDKLEDNIVEELELIKKELGVIQSTFTNDQHDATGKRTVYSVATADFYQEKIVAPLAVRVNGYLLEDGNFIFRFVAHDYEKMVLTSNTGNIILTGWLKVPAAENRWKKVSTWTNNNMAYSIKNFKGYGGNNGGDFTGFDMKCFLNDEDIDQGNGKDIAVKGNVESDVLCKRQCQIDIRCQSFVYATSKKLCFLKSRKVRDAAIKHANGVVSGPKYCEKEDEKQVYSGATADFYQEGIVAALAINVNGYLLEDGNFIFRFVAPGYEKLVLTSNTGNIISSGFVKLEKRNKKLCRSQKCIRLWENRWKDVSKWTKNNMEYSIKNFDIGMGMALFKANGHCSIGYYNTLGINDLQSCFSLCLKDAACQYVSYLPKSTCSLYKYGQCGIVSSTTYNTYRKVQKAYSMEMVKFKEKGHCSTNYYAGHDGLTDLQSCFSSCVSEENCAYVSFHAGVSCSRYSHGDCGFRTDYMGTSQLYTTYKKVQKGQCPNDYPYAFSEGKYCCAHDREKNDPQRGGGERCDGGKISLSSSCCKDDKSIQCPSASNGGSCVDHAVPVPFYMFRSSTRSDKYFYTTNANELGTLDPSENRRGWMFLQIECRIFAYQVPGSQPLYRYFRSIDHAYFYTTNINELGTSGNHGYQYDWIAGYCFPTKQEGTVPLQRYYAYGTHLFITNRYYKTFKWSNTEFKLEGTVCYVYPAHDIVVPFYRYYRKDDKDHLYTTNPKEIGVTRYGEEAKGYKSEGYECQILSTRELPILDKRHIRSRPLYRYYNGQDHLYTQNILEIGNLANKMGYRSQGVAGYCFPNPEKGTIPLHRYYGTHNGNHFYSTNRHEITGNSGYKYEGIVCHVIPAENRPLQWWETKADGGYSNWSAWTACTKKYGGGTKDRARECTNPVPQNGGKTCDTLGSSKETVSCNTWNKQGYVGDLMKTSFSRLDNPALGESSKTNLAPKWEGVLKTCVENGNCQGEFSAQTDNLEAVALGFQGAEDVIESMTRVVDGKAVSKITKIVKSLGKIAPLLGAGGAVFGIFAAFGDSPEEQMLEEVIEMLNEGFQRIEYRFDKIERSFKDLELVIAKQHFWTRLDGNLKDLSSAQRRVDAFLNVKGKDLREQRRKDLDKDQYNKVFDAMSAIKDTFEGKHGQTLCKEVTDFSNGDRKTVSDVSTDLYNRMVKAALNHIIISKASNRIDTKNREKEMVKDLEDIAKRIQACDKEIEEKVWLKTWKSDLDKSIDYPAGAQSDDKSNAMANRIYSTLSKKYYWRDWLVAVFPAIVGYEKKIGKFHVCGKDSGKTVHKDRTNDYHILVSSVNRVASSLSDLNLFGLDIVLMKYKKYNSDQLYDIFYQKLPQAVKSCQTGQLMGIMDDVNVGGNAEGKGYELALRGPAKRKYYKEVATRERHFHFFILG